MLGAMIRKSPFEIASGRLEPCDFERLIDARKDLAKLPLVIDDRPALTLSAIRAQARRHKRRNGLGLVVVDHLGCQRRSKKGPPWRCKKGPLGGCGLVPVVHGRAPRATRRALNRLTRRRAREGPVGPRGQAWAGWSVQLAVGV